MRFLVSANLQLIKILTARVKASVPLTPNFYTPYPPVYLSFLLLYSSFLVLQHFSLFYVDLQLCIHFLKYQSLVFMFVLLSICHMQYIKGILTKTQGKVHLTSTSLVFEITLIGSTVKERQGDIFVTTCLKVECIFYCVVFTVALFSFFSSCATK